MEAWQRVLQGDQGLIEGGLDKQPSQSAQDTGAQEDAHTHPGRDSPFLEAF